MRKEIPVNPRLICNNLKNNTKVITEIEDNLYACDSFDLSVAFISESGLASIMQPLLDVVKKGTEGRIVTSTYLGFNSPKMFKKLYHLFKKSNVQIRIYQKEGFHPKGYIFKKESFRNIIIGSSNLTQDALSVNQEWNICVKGHSSDEIVNRIDNEFTEQWKESKPLTIKWIEDYEKNYLTPIKYYVAPNGKKGFEPNVMQVEALESLNTIRKDGKRKALLISATGTGKTFLSAFDVKQFGAKKMLFVVHRETIAKKSLDSYKRIILNKKMGMFTGTEKDIECDYLFSTINTIGKKEYLSRFKKDEFDYIVIDEVHRAGAKMYENLLNYFEPRFLLGMSATPERTDNPQKIYDLFDYNIAYEIRLKQAMKYKLLCPFHYYGISDLTINGETIDDKSKFSKLTSLDRTRHIINAIETYGYSGEKPHGLIFVSRKEEAEELSDVFNKISNYKTIALTSSNSNNEDRRKAIELLEEKDKNKEYIDYIFTVDLFNEGVDIPCVNQVVMARRTESSIVFIQQLGRGLRKNDNKEYVTVIDIIGNYDNNYMIPIALSGSQNYNKDELRRFIHEGNTNLPGASTVSFDEITKKRIYDSIDKAKINSIKIIRDEYQKLKAKLGNRIPSLLDFDKHSSIDPTIIFNAKKSSKSVKKGTHFESYYNFLVAEDNDYKVRLSENEEKFVNYVSLKFANGKRAHELLAIKLLIEETTDLFRDLKIQLLEKFRVEYDEKITTTLINELSGKFCVGSDSKFSKVVFIKNVDNKFVISDTFKKLLNNTKFREIIIELIEFGFSRYFRDYQNTYLDTDFVLYNKYSYDDVFRLMNWEKAEVSLNVGGYKYDINTNTLPVFINYDKTNAANSIKYEDTFVDKEHINALSKHPRRLNSSDARIIENASINNTKIHMFIRKNKNDAIEEFYYLGLVEKCGDFVPVKDMENNDEFIIPYKFQTPVREDVYSYMLG